MLIVCSLHLMLQKQHSISVIFLLKTQNPSPTVKTKIRPTLTEGHSMKYPTSTPNDCIDNQKQGKSSKL